MTSNTYLQWSKHFSGWKKLGNTLWSSKSQILADVWYIFYTKNRRVDPENYLAFCAQTFFNSWKFPIVVAFHKRRSYFPVFTHEKCVYIINNWYTILSVVKCASLLFWILMEDDFYDKNHCDDHNDGPHHHWHSLKEDWLPVQYISEQPCVD